MFLFLMERNTTDILDLLWIFRIVEQRMILRVSWTKRPAVLPEISIIINNNNSWQTSVFSSKIIGSLIKYCVNQWKYGLSLSYLYWPIKASIPLNLYSPTKSLSLFNVSTNQMKALIFSFLCSPTKSLSLYCVLC